MKKIFNWMLAAIITCGASVFTSCTNGNGDNPVVPVEPDLNVAEKIIGKWMVAERDGEPALTNEKNVFTFLSATKAYQSVSRVDYDETKPKWRAKEECDMTIDGNTVTLLSHSSNIDKVFTLSEFDDGENHRWEYLLDGTFNYFHKVDGQWQISDDDYADYFVDGNLLCTRWKNEGAGNEEHREWWEIESIEDGVMKWKALRQKEDGTTYTATFEMKKVDVPTKAEVEQFILGKWMISEIDGEDVVTNLKTVYDFESLTKVYMSASLNFIPELPTIWNNKIELSVALVDNHIALAGQKDDKTAVIEEFIVSYITADVMQCVLLHSEINGEGEVVTVPGVFCTFKKVDKDFSQTILGTWEGQATSDEGTYGDGKQHRWEYKADGTFVYYVKDGDDWVPSTNTLNEYFVAGNLLCTRWIDNEIEYLEWWEIESIENDVMKWKALRQKEDGTTFTSTFEMKKIDVSSEEDGGGISDDIGFW